MSKKTKLYSLRRELKGSFTELKNNALDLNRMMAHLGRLTEGLDLLINEYIGPDFLFEEHMQMLASPPTNLPPEITEPRPLVREIGPWRSLGKTVKAGGECDLSKVPSDQLFFWADTHFMHKYIIEYAHRPFKDLPEMHAKLLENYNKKITDDDVVVWAGDISFTNDNLTNEWLDQFNGYKILVVGNHDIDRGKLKRLNFDEIHTSLTFDRFVVTHHPWTGHLPPKMVNIHGHMHDRPFHFENHVGVSVELIDYAPISLWDLKRNYIGEL